MSEFKEHPDLADLAGHFWAPSDESRIAHHLDTCRRCRGAYENLVVQLRADSERYEEEAARKPATFWIRQRIAIQRSIASDPARRRSSTRRVVFGLAAAAVVVLAFALGAWFARSHPGQPSVRSTTVAASTSTVASNTQPAGTDAPLFEPRSDDPWSTSELEPFRPVVEWETWLDASNSDSQEGAS